MGSGSPGVPEIVGFIPSTIDEEALLWCSLKAPNLPIPEPPWMILFLPFEKQLQTRHSNPESSDNRNKERPGNEANQRRRRYFRGIWTFTDGHFLPTFPIFVSPPLRSDSHTTSLAEDFRAWVKSLVATTGKLFSTQPSLFPGLSETCFSVKTSVQVFLPFFEMK